MTPRKNRSLIACLTMAAAMSGTAVAADQVKQVDLVNAKLSYTEKRLWFSLPWSGPKFARPQSFSHEDYVSHLDTHLKVAGFETGSASGIQLEIIEDYAGKLAQYHKPVPDDAPQANGLQVAGELVITALLSKFGLFSPNQVSTSTAANMAVVTVNSLGQTIAPSHIGNSAPQAPLEEKTREAAGDDLLVVLRVCSTAGKQCIATAAAATVPMSLDDLRQISVDEGVTRALGLPPGPIATATKTTH